MFKLLTPLIILLLVSFSLSTLKERHLFDVRTLAQIDPIPQIEQLMAQEKYAQAHEYLEYFLQFQYVQENPRSSELLQEIREKRESLSYKTDKVLEGIFAGKSDENIGRAAAIASDFFVIGDIRDLSIEGMNYANDKEVDKFIVTLSSLGLLATATTVYTMGASTPIKSSISVLKYGKRMNKIPKWFQASLIRQVEFAKKTNSLERVQKLLTPIQKLYDKVGLNQTLMLLSKTRNFNHLKNVTKFGSRFQRQSSVLLNITNNKALYYSRKMPNVPKRNLLYASTYGENGLKGLYKLGEQRFFKKVKFTSNLTKTTYKGNLNALLDAIPNKILFAISFLGLFYFIWKFYRFYRRLF
jgi:hypothetical protein